MTRNGPALILDRLVRSAATGEPSRLPNTRKPVISIDGMHALIRHGIWPEALRQIVALDAVHPTSQLAFAQAWKRMQFRTAMNGVDDDLFYAGLRKMLPAYELPIWISDRTPRPFILYRGQDPDAPVGVSWTCLDYVALRFALFGFDDPHETSPKRGNVVLTATVPPSAIISSPHFSLDGDNGGGEFIIDPRGITYTSEPARTEDTP